MYNRLVHYTSDDKVSYLYLSLSLTFQLQSGNIPSTGMQLHRQDSHFKKCKPTRPEVVKSGQNINARSDSGYGQPAYALAA